jgi:hypothetical protein
MKMDCSRIEKNSVKLSQLCVKMEILPWSKSHGSF